MSKYKKSEIDEARATLREWIKPGQTIYSCLRSVSASGMFRLITVHIIKDGDLLDISYQVARAIDCGRSERNGIGQGALRVSGCGMDMGFHIVHSLGYALARDSKSEAFKLFHRWV